MCKIKYWTWFTLAFAGAWRTRRLAGGEEMGGLRGVKHYLQRTALQGSPTTITAITNVYQPHAKGKDPGKHPFQKYFEELQIGDQIITEKRVITSEDIDRFADLSGDHFYAHIKTTDFTGTMFEQTGGTRLFYHEHCCRIIC